MRDIEDKIAIISLDTSFQSNPKHTYNHPLFLELVEMGEPVVEYCIDRMRNAPLQWIYQYLLVKITGINPIKDENRGYLEKSTRDWINWYDKK